MLLLALLAAVAAETPPPRVFRLDPQAIAQVRARALAKDPRLAPALERLRADAKQALTAGPFTVMTKSVTPPSGDKHDYMSQAPYFWPNPATPDGLPYVNRDGERNPEINQITDHQNMDRMVSAVETLALAYFFKGDEAYASKAAQLLRAWFLDAATHMNPNLQYAQFIPG
ncbi:MAG TPA: alginate lyase family protein, partial [Vicinamibacteria bacterium]